MIPSRQTFIYLDYMAWADLCQWPMLINDFAGWKFILIDGPIGLQSAWVQVRMEDCKWESYQDVFLKL